MRYIISYDNPSSHYINIVFVVDKINSDFIDVQLPAWRPGRYELGNFAKNIQKWTAFNKNGEILKSSKLTKDCWRIETIKNSEIHIKYNYYAAELNAGSTYLDDKQLYMNPVNCCLFVSERISEECIVEIAIPDDYEVATAMSKKGKGISNTKGQKIETFITKDFHELADSPFIASNTLQSNMFVLDGIEFYVWFQGECKPKWSKIINDFFIFINEQFIMMKEFNSTSYHFLFQILPVRFYHGVEHLNSTVIALGPSYNLMKGDIYEDLLGISSHELFHSWNIKTVRPVEMMPYDYTKENYSRLGYVCEGVTTYYGDFLLFRSGIYSESEYFKSFNERLQKHFDNFGRYNLSVADSSFDTWLDGYVPGVPNRKTSIYDEGCLLAFVTDILIRRNTENKNSLDDLMRYLFFEYGKHNKGYTEAEYKKSVEMIGGTNFDDFFNKYVWSASSYEDIVEESLNYIRCKLQNTASKKFNESAWGFKALEGGGVCKVSAIYPKSIAENAGLTIGDEVLAINNIPIKDNFNDWIEYWSTAKNIELTVVSNSTIKKIQLHILSEVYYKTWFVSKIESSNDVQKNNFKLWCKRVF